MKKAISTEDPGTRVYTKNLQTLDLEKIHHIGKTSEDSAFFMVDLSRIINQYQNWVRQLPFVTPYYAIKCNPNPSIISLLASLGCRFDCASRGEIQTVMNTGVSSDRIIYANPIKGASHLEYAKEVGVDLMTFDCESELEKIHTYYKEARIVLRLAVDDSHSTCKFNTKFGTRFEEVDSLLSKAKKLGMDVVGVSFHVGSGCKDAEVYKDAIGYAANVMSEGRKIGHSMKILDIGGGYPATSRYIEFDSIVEKIEEAHQDIERNHEELSDIEWIAEPGRYMVGSSHTLVTEIIGVKREKEKTRYYLNEGVYGSLSGIMFDYTEPLFTTSRETSKNAKKIPSIIFGPTCDSLDKVGEFMLPELNIGDKIYFHVIGDYSIASASSFNGFALPKPYYFLSNAQDKKYIKNVKNIELI